MIFIKKIKSAVCLFSLLSFACIWSYPPPSSYQTQYNPPPSSYQTQYNPPPINYPIQYNPPPPQYNPPPPSYPAQYSPQPQYYPPQGYPGGGVVYPSYGYPTGGYLPPQPVKPGEDEADAIYRANQHSGR